MCTQLASPNLQLNMHLDRLIGAESHVDQSLAAQRDKTYTMGFAVNTKLLPMKAHYFFFHCGK